MKLAPPSPITVWLLWISATFMAVKTGVEKWPAALAEFPQVADWGWLSFVPLALLSAAGAITILRSILPRKEQKFSSWIEDDPEWESKLEVVTGEHFSRCEVRLDGYNYNHCTFENVTFVYNGGRCILKKNNIGAHTIKSEIRAIATYGELLINLGHTKSQIITENGPIQLSELDARTGNRREQA